MVAAGLGGDITYCPAEEQGVGVITIRHEPPVAALSTWQLCLRFAGYAEDYATAAMALGEAANFFSARYFLFGHAFELILKSYILSKGADERKLRELSHSLVKAYVEAKHLGYSPSDLRLETIVDWIGAYHEHQDFRYAKTQGVTTMPGAAETLAIFKNTHADIYPLARAFYTERSRA
ncbi:hypothetical protein M2171_005248 [Bradyrhizobium japonicum USDA 38]|uniref:hypothetical protein n=1 Tax=Bradyrhizobium japonicum TaxID=375 RepID=UPI000482479A|nr:hypothetical protein [Bradyrhizobium japonicum]MCS3896115.1 hypothetical protein [Bradyrhizobium japonicum USDA 38]MCS3948629.1 hypothetical protein [Bradyrhizobium japonicum]